MNIIQKLTKGHAQGSGATSQEADGRMWRNSSSYEQQLANLWRDYEQVASIDILVKQWKLNEFLIAFVKHYQQWYPNHIKHEAKVKETSNGSCGTIQNHAVLQLVLDGLNWLGDAYRSGDKRLLKEVEERSRYCQLIQQAQLICMRSKSNVLYMCNRGLVQLLVGILSNVKQHISQQGSAARSACILCYHAAHSLLNCVVDVEDAISPSNVQGNKASKAAIATYRVMWNVMVRLQLAKVTLDLIEINPDTVQAAVTHVADTQQQSMSQQPPQQSIQAQHSNDDKGLQLTSNSLTKTLCKLLLKLLRVGNDLNGQKMPITSTVLLNLMQQLTEVSSSSTSSVPLSTLTSRVQYMSTLLYLLFNMLVLHQQHLSDFSRVHGINIVTRVVHTAREICDAAQSDAAVNEDNNHVSEMEQQEVSDRTVTQMSASLPKIRASALNGMNCSQRGVDQDTLPDGSIVQEYWHVIDATSSSVHDMESKSTSPNLTLNDGTRSRVTQMHSDLQPLYETFAQILLRVFSFSLIMCRGMDGEASRHIGGTTQTSSANSSPRPTTLHIGETLFHLIFCEFTPSSHPTVTKCDFENYTRLHENYNATTHAKRFGSDIHAPTQSIYRTDLVFLQQLKKILMPKKIGLSSVSSKEARIAASVYKRHVTMQLTVLHSNMLLHACPIMYIPQLAQQMDLGQALKGSDLCNDLLNVQAIDEEGEFLEWWSVYGDQYTPTSLLSAPSAPINFGSALDHSKGQREQGEARAETSGQLSHRIGDEQGNDSDISNQQCEVRPTELRSGCHEVPKSKLGDSSGCESSKQGSRQSATKIVKQTSVSGASESDSSTDSWRSNDDMDSAADTVASDMFTQSMSNVSESVMYRPSVSALQVNAPQSVLNNDRLGSADALGGASDSDAGSSTPSKLYDCEHKETSAPNTQKKSLLQDVGCVLVCPSHKPHSCSLLQASAIHGHMLMCVKALCSLPHDASLHSSHDKHTQKSDVQSVRHMFSRLMQAFVLYAPTCFVLTQRFSHEYVSMTQQMDVAMLTKLFNFGLIDATLAAVQANTVLFNQTIVQLQATQRYCEGMAGDCMMMAMEHVQVRAPDKPGALNKLEAAVLDLLTRRYPMAYKARDQTKDEPHEKYGSKHLKEISEQRLADQPTHDGLENNNDSNVNSSSCCGVLVHPLLLELCCVRVVLLRLLQWYVDIHLVKGSNIRHCKQLVQAFMQYTGLHVCRDIIKDYVVRVLSQQLAQRQITASIESRKAGMRTLAKILQSCVSSWGIHVKLNNDTTQDKTKNESNAQQQPMCGSEDSHNIDCSGANHENQQACDVLAILSAVQQISKRGGVQVRQQLLGSGMDTVIINVLKHNIPNTYKTEVLVESLKSLTSMLQNNQQGKEQLFSKLSAHKLSQYILLHTDVIDKELLHIVTSVAMDIVPGDLRSTSPNRTVDNITQQSSDFSFQVYRNELFLQVYIILLKRADAQTCIWGLTIFSMLLSTSQINTHLATKANIAALLLNWFEMEQQLDIQISLLQVIKVLAAQHFSVPQVRRICRLLQPGAAPNYPTYLPHLIASFTWMAQKGGGAGAVPGAYFDFSALGSGLVKQGNIDKLIPSKGWSCGIGLCMDRNQLAYPKGLQVLMCYLNTSQSQSLNVSPPGGFLICLKSDTRQLVLAGIDKKWHMIEFQTTVTPDTWQYITITHQGATAFTSSITCLYIDSKLVEQSTEKVPSTLSSCTKLIVASQVPEIDPYIQGYRTTAFRGQISCLYCYQGVLSEQQVNDVFSLGYNYQGAFSEFEISWSTLSHSSAWNNLLGRSGQGHALGPPNLNFVNVIPGVQSLKAGKHTALAEKLRLAYSPLNCVGLTVYDLCHVYTATTSPHAQLQPPTQVCVSRHFTEMLQAVGGLSCFLPLVNKPPLLPDKGSQTLTAMPEPTQLDGSSQDLMSVTQPQHWVQLILNAICVLIKHTGSMSFTGSTHATGKSGLVENQFQVLAYLLTRNPQFVDVDVMHQLNSISVCIMNSDRFQGMVSSWLSDIELNLRLWRRTNSKVQIMQLERISRIISNASTTTLKQIKHHMTLSYLLSATWNYFRVQNGSSVKDRAGGSDTLSDERDIGEEGAISECTEVHDRYQQIVFHACQIVQQLMLTQPEGCSQQDMQVVGSIAMDTSDEYGQFHILAQILHVITTIPHFKHSAIEHLNTIGGPSLFMVMLSSSNKQTRYLALRYIALLFSASPATKLTNNQSCNSLQQKGEQNQQRLSIKDVIGSYKDSQRNGVVCCMAEVLEQHGMDQDFKLQLFNLIGQSKDQILEAYTQQGDTQAGFQLSNSGSTESQVKAKPCEQQLTTARHDVTNKYNHKPELRDSHNTQGSGDSLTVDIQGNQTRQAGVSSDSECIQRPKGQNVPLRRTLLDTSATNKLVQSPHFVVLLLRMLLSCQDIETWIDYLESLENCMSIDSGNVLSMQSVDYFMDMLLQCMCQAIANWGIGSKDSKEERLWNLLRVILTHAHAACMVHVQGGAALVDYSLYQLSITLPKRIYPYVLHTVLADILHVLSAQCNLPHIYKNISRAISRSQITSTIDGDDALVHSTDWYTNQTLSHVSLFRDGWRDIGTRQPCCSNLVALAGLIEEVVTGVSPYSPIMYRILKVNTIPINNYFQQYQPQVSKAQTTQESSTSTKTTSPSPAKQTGQTSRQQSPQKNSLQIKIDQSETASVQSAEWSGSADRLSQDVWRCLGVVPSKISVEETLQKSDKLSHSQQGLEKQHQLDALHIAYRPVDSSNGKQGDPLVGDSAEGLQISQGTKVDAETDPTYDNNTILGSQQDIATESGDLDNKQQQNGQSDGVEILFNTFNQNSEDDLGHTLTQYHQQESFWSMIISVYFFFATLHELESSSAIFSNNMERNSAQQPLMSLADVLLPSDTNADSPRKLQTIATDVLSGIGTLAASTLSPRASGGSLAQRVANLQAAGESMLTKGADFANKSKLDKPANAKQQIELPPIPKSARTVTRSTSDIIQRTLSRAIMLLVQHDAPQHVADTAMQPILGLLLNILQGTVSQTSDKQSSTALLYLYMAVNTSSTSINSHYNKKLVMDAVRTAERRANFGSCRQLSTASDTTDPSDITQKQDTNLKLLPNLQTKELADLLLKELNLVNAQVAVRLNVNYVHHEMIVTCLASSDAVKEHAYKMQWEYCGNIEAKEHERHLLEFKYATEWYISAGSAWQKAQSMLYSEVGVFGGVQKIGRIGSEGSMSGNSSGTAHAQQVNDGLLCSSDNGYPPGVYMKRARNEDAWRRCTSLKRNKNYILYDDSVKDNNSTDQAKQGQNVAIAIDKKLLKYLAPSFKEEQFEQDTTDEADKQEGNLTPTPINTQQQCSDLASPSSASTSPRSPKLKSPQSNNILIPQSPKQQSPKLQSPKQQSPKVTSPVMGPQIVDKKSPKPSQIDGEAAQNSLSNTGDIPVVSSAVNSYIQQAQSSVISDMIRQDHEQAVAAAKLRKQLHFAEQCDHITVHGTQPGRVELLHATCVFIPYQLYSSSSQQDVQDNLEQFSQLRIKKIGVKNMTRIVHNRFMMKYSAVEIFTSNKKSYYFNFDTCAACDAFISTVLTLKPSLEIVDKKRRRVLVAQATKSWQQREISNLEYLLLLNTYAGRSNNDLNQYPCVPWVLKDYESSSIDVNDESIYRDLSKPVGALDPDRLAVFIERYKMLDKQWRSKAPGAMVPFYYGSHYSSTAIVLFFLIRLEPFTFLNRSLQGGRFDHADRLFNSVSQTWQYAQTNTSDVKELIPEFYYAADFLDNNNKYDFGKRQDGLKIDGVQLPPWANNSSHQFIQTMRAAIESEYTSAHLHEWVDLIFGYKQRGHNAVKSHNVFYYLTYEGSVDVESITDPLEKTAVRDQMCNFGQTPIQLFTRPHPARGTGPSPWASTSLALCNAPDVSMLKYDVAGIPRGHETNANPVLLLSYQNNKLIVLRQNRKFSTFKVYNASTPQPKSLPQCSGKFMHVALAIDLDKGQTGAAKDKLLRGAGDYLVQLKQNCYTVLCDGKYIVSGGFYDNSLKWYSTDNASVVASYALHLDTVTCVACTEETASTRVLVTGSRDSQLMLWELSSNKIGSGAGGGGRVGASGDGLSTSVDKASDGAKECSGKTLPGGVIAPSRASCVDCSHDSEITNICVHQGLSVVVSSCTSGRILFHSLHNLKLKVATSLPRGLLPAQIIILPQPALVVVISSSNRHGYTYTINGQLVSSHEFHEQVVCCITSPCERFCCAAFSSGHILWWDAITWTPRGSLQVEDSVTSLCCGGSGVLFVGMCSGQVTAYTPLWPL